MALGIIKKITFVSFAGLTALWGFSFLSGLFITFMGCPRWIELPWSGFGDYVEAIDGRVYVEARFYGRILCYEKNGKFVANYAFPIRNAKDTGLASGENGFIYFRTRNSVYGFDRNWNIVFSAEEDPSMDRTWKMSRKLSPSFAPGEGGKQFVPDRAISTNELLFSSTQDGVRQSFTCTDGTILERDGNALIRRSKEGGMLHRYSDARIVSLLRFPWPSVLGFPLFLLLVGFAIYAKIK
jgi:hypothetical protein